ncbi:MAG TPA: acyl-CoA thioesterase/bile acid-CoA:amino acid N-acyltransferase family protein [Polyangiaceae bacterium]
MRALPWLSGAIVCPLMIAACSSASPENAPGPTVDAGTTSDASATSAAAVTFYDVSSGTPTPTTSMLWTNALDIRVTGLAPNVDATITGRFTGWGATETFTSDADGTIDLATAAPKTGTYEGADPDGLIWSMTASTSADDPKDDPFALRVRVDVDGNEVASATLERLALTPDVTCTNVTDDGLVGYFCAKTGAPAKGAIVTFGGSEGGLSTGASQAQYFASLGYPSLGLAYFGATGVPATLENVPLEYFATAFAWVEKRPSVAPGKLMVVGGSRGGELALLLGATFPQVTSVVAQLPSGLVWPGIGTDPNANVPAWTYQGTPLAYVTPSGLGTNVKEPDGVTAYSETPAFHSSIAAATPAALDAATTHVENTAGPILMVAGASDELWPSCDLAKIASDRLDAAGHTIKYGDVSVCYPDAGHNIDAFSVGVPTTTAMHASQKVDGFLFALGGTPKGISAAARDADVKTRAFFAANL